MNIDERLDRLTQRHEALAQSVALVLGPVRENTHLAEGTAVDVRALTLDVGTLTGDVRALTGNIRGLAQVVEGGADNIRALARIAEMHENRITRIEDVQ